MSVTQWFRDAQCNPTHVYLEVSTTVLNRAYLPGSASRIALQMMFWKLFGLTLNWATSSLHGKPFSYDPISTIHQ